MKNVVTHHPGRVGYCDDDIAWPGEAGYETKRTAHEDMLMRRNVCRHGVCVVVLTIAGPMLADVHCQ